MKSANIFAALDTSAAKSSKKKDKNGEKKSKAETAAIDTAELERAIFSQPSTGMSNWADCDEEDDGFAPATNISRVQVRIGNATAADWARGSSKSFSQVRLGRLGLACRLADTLAAQRRDHIVTM